MSDIPMFSARGNTDTERLSEIMSYLTNLSSAIDRELLSIDFSNLNSDLAGRINKSITEHQDLSSFASKNYAKKNFTSFELVNAIKEELETEINKINAVVGNWSYEFPYESITEAISELKEKVSLLEERISALEK